MAGKRKHQESESQEAVHESRQFQVYGNKPKPAKKPRKSEPVRKKQSSSSAVNDIKKQIRNVRRRLERVDNLPADIRAEDERALAAYEQELAAAEAEKIRQKMIKRYHMVRFFERQKATRQLKKLRKRILEAESTEEVETLKSEMHVAEVDLSYTQYCPLSEPYISLYPQKTHENNQDEDVEEENPPKPPMWAEVERRMEERTLNQLRNRVANTPVNIPRPLERRPAKPKAAPVVDTIGLNRRERRSQLRGKETKPQTKSKSIGFEKNQAFGASQAVAASGHETGQDDDSDGGFFED